MIAMARPGQVHPGLVGDHTPSQDEDPVGEEQRLVHVVGDEQHAGPVPSPQVEHQPVDGDPGQRVQGAERLVQQEQVGLADQGPGQGGPLGLPPDRVSGQAPCSSPSPTSSSAARRRRARSGAWSPSATLASIRFHGTSRGPGRRRRRCPPPATSPSLRGRVRPAPAAAWTCPSRCGRAARRTRRRIPGRAVEPPSQVRRADPVSIPDAASRSGVAASPVEEARSPLQSPLRADDEESVSRPRAV